MKKKTLWLAMAGILSTVAVTGVVIAQTTVDGQPSSVNQPVKAAEVPAFMQSMDTPGGQTTQQQPAATTPSAVPSGVQPAPVAMPEPIVPPAMGAIPYVPSPMGTPMMGTAVASGGGLTMEEKMYFAEQARLQRDTTLMESKVKLAEQQLKYNEAVAKMISASVAQPAANVKEKKEEKKPASDLASEMILVSVYGEGRNLTGEVFYRGGRISVKRGDKLPGNMLVTNIEPTRIVVRNGKKSSEINLGQPPASE